VDDKDGKYLAEMLRVLGETEAWAARTNAGAPRLRPAPRSSLRGDDEQTHPYELSHAVWRHLSNTTNARPSPQRCNGSWPAGPCGLPVT